MVGEVDVVHQTCHQKCERRLSNWGVRKKHDSCSVWERDAPMRRVFSFLSPETSAMMRGV